MNSILSRNELGWAGGQSSPNPTTRPMGVAANGIAGLNVVVDWLRGEICHGGGRRCKLSARETALLACLASKAGTPVSRDEILAQVWNLDPSRTTTRTIDMHITHLRRKLDDDAEAARILITVHGVGYMIHRGAISSHDVHPPTGEGEPGPCQGTTGIESASAL